MERKNRGMGVENRKMRRRKEKRYRRRNRGMGVKNKKRRGKSGRCEETMGIWVWKTGDKRKTGGGNRMLGEEDRRM